MNFSFYYRNPGHWDVVTATARAFCIRGEAPAFFIRDERKDGRSFPRDSIGPFPTLASATAWITGTLMQETVE